jgi:acyl-CoA thioesterase FadM
VSASFEFHRALRFEDEFEVWLRVTAIGTKTIHFSCLLTRDDTKIATGALTIACASQRPNEPLKAIPIPPEIASRFRVASALET